MAHPAIQLDGDRIPTGPWVFARHVREASDVEDGSVVEVLDGSGRFLGHGLFNGRSDVRVRWLSRGKRHDLDRPEEFLQRRLAAAARLRRRVLRLPEVTDAWRLAHAEGDDLPGLVVDHLASVLVCEYHALGFWRLRDAVAAALGRLHPRARVVHRLPEGAARAEGVAPTESTEDDPGEVWITEHGLGFPVVPGGKHKTGWFCDQRDNRQRVAALARDRTVLDLCTNTGGFALFAAAAGARRVVGVDLDEHALDRARRAGERAGLEVEWRHADAYHHLRGITADARRPELVVVDPHKLVRGRSDLERGLRRYLDLNALALGALAPGGLLATFSCSGALDLPGFLGMVFRAARRAGRGVRLVEVLGAAPDHPQRPDFPKSRYLKGALLAADP